MFGRLNLLRLTGGSVTSVRRCDIPVWFSNSFSNYPHTRTWRNLSASNVAGNPASNDDEGDTMVIAKAIARAGYCSRRTAAELVKQNKVLINGVVASVNTRANPWFDSILIHGKRLEPPQRTRVFLVHKPAGCLTTTSDPQGRPTIYDTVRSLPNLQLFPIGRLDFNTEGLLLLTNDGELKRYMELPHHEFERRYRVRLFGEPVTNDFFQILKKGVTIDGLSYRSIIAELLRDHPTPSPPARFNQELKGRAAEREAGGAYKFNQWIQVTIREGKNREIRRVMEHFGYEVARLIRTGYGPFDLGDLPLRECKEGDSSAVSRLIASAAAASKDITGGDPRVAAAGSRGKQEPRPALERESGDSGDGEYGGKYPSGERSRIVTSERRKMSDVGPDGSNEAGSSRRVKPHRSMPRSRYE